MGGEKVGAEQKGAPISGYCGFQAGVSAGNIFGADFVKQQSMAAAHEAALTEAARNATNPIFAGGDYLRTSTSVRDFPDKAPYPEVLRRADRRIAKYGGFVPGVSAENIYGKTFCDSQEVVPHGNKLASIVPPSAEPAWWAKASTNSAPADGKQKVGYGGFVPRLYAENIHGATFAETQKVADIVDDELTMSRMNVADVPRDDAPLQASHISHEDHSQDKKIPGYGGYVPAIYAKNVFGATFEHAQKIAERTLADNIHPTAASDYSTEPYSVQPNPHVSTAQIEGRVKISGYAGFVPSIASDNVVGENWEDSQFSSQEEPPTKVMHKNPKIVDSKQLKTHTPASAPPASAEKHRVPGYAGYVPKIYAQNIYGRTFEKSQSISMQNS